MYGGWEWGEVGEFYLLLRWCHLLTILGFIMKGGMNKGHVFSLRLLTASGCDKN